LTKYFGGLAAVDRLDFDVQEGELVGLIGPNGAGKTTVFNLITGFLRPTGGKIIFNEKDVTNRKPHSVAASGIVRTFQATNLFGNFTVFESIVAACYLKSTVGFWGAFLHTPGSRRDRVRIEERALDIMRFVGLESMRDQRARNLAYGHKRVLGMALSLAADPQLLLLDEPLSGMNAGEVDSAIALIRRIFERGTAILLIEHNMRAAMSLCQRIVVLQMGRKISVGSPDEVRADKRVIQAYLGTGKHVA
jgi:branched-chain amino acid transport system ATP-binding protein